MVGDLLMEDKLEDLVSLWALPHNRESTLDISYNQEDSMGMRHVKLIQAVYLV